MIRIFTIASSLFFLILFSGCVKQEDPNAILAFNYDECINHAVTNGHVFFEEGVKWLVGGDSRDQDFDITTWEFRECQLNYGLGREYFTALIEPAYVNLSEHQDDFAGDEKVIVLLTEDKPKVYPLVTMRDHQVINERIAGEPVMITYCIISELTAVYSRTYCDTTFTFALSGYTYWDPEAWDGENVFLLWDRETESLWWPVTTQAVSGDMMETQLIRYNENKWLESTWKDVVNNYPNALLLEPGQTMDPPVDWVRYTNLDCFIN